MCLALAVAVVTFIAMVIVGNAVVAEVYLSSEAVDRRMGAQISSFRSFVAEQSLASTDVNAVGQWNRDHPNIYLTIYGMNTTISSTPEGAELVVNESGIVVRSDLQLQLSKEYPVAFDMEENNVENERIDGLSAEELTEIALAFCDRVRERGYTPIVYGNDKWLNGYFDLSKLAGEELLWLAEYDDQPSVSYNFKIWQYTSTADLPGSGGNLDMDLMFPDN